MPVYGKEKNKQMGRSILPSNARKQIKKRKDGLHRQNRHIVNSSLHTLRGQASNVIDDYEDDNTDFEYYVEPHRSNDGWSDIVYDRRTADHLNHFEVWAYERTKHMRPQDRWSKLSTMIDGDLIGYHAMTHLEFLKHDPLDRNNWHDNLPTRYRRNHYRGRSYASDNKRIRTELLAALKSIAHDDRKRRKFNEHMIKYASRDVQTIVRWNFDAYDPLLKMIKRYARYEEKIVYEGARTLNGYHDVNKFMIDIFAATRKDPKLGYHPSWLGTAKAYFDIK
jgi:hypothetical protein